MSSNNKLYSNIYDIQQFWLTKIAPKYFDMGSLDLHRAGLFGYTNEVMSTVTEDIANANAVLLNEIFPTKANLPEIILNYCSQYQITDIDAIPATIPLVIGIEQKSLLENSTVSADNLEFIIDKDSQIVVDDTYVFMIDYDIKIVSKFVNDNYVHTAQYIMDTRNPLADDVSIPYLKTYKMNNHNEDYIFITIRARQVSKYIVDETVYSADIIDNYSRIIPYDHDQLAGFNVFYKSPKTSEYIQLKTLLDGSSYINEPFCFYLYSNERELKIRFPNLYNYFSLEFNAELRYELYLTKGKSGNISYSGKNIKFIPKSDRYDYSNITMLCELLGDATNGFDKKSMDEIKEMIQEQGLTNGTITTDIDLNKVLDKLANSKIMVIKKRDDIIKRLFEAFILMIDKEDNIIPTNTLDINLLEEDFDLIQDGSRIINAGSIFRLENNVLNKATGDSIDPYDYEKTNFLYSNLFTIILRQDPFFVSFYLNSINKRVLFDMVYINPYSYIQFILNDFTIYRNALSDDGDSNKYKFTVQVTSNTDISFPIADLDENGNITTDYGRLKAFILFKENELDIGYIPLTLTKLTDEGSYIFECFMETNDYITPYNKLQINNSITAMGGESPELSVTIPIEELNISVLTFIDIGGQIYDSTPYHSTINGVSDYKLTNIYSNENDRVDIVVDMLNYMSSFVNVIDVDTYYYYLIKMVPMFRYTYLKDSLYIGTILENIDSTLRLIDTNSALLENNNSVNIKWYNTYGPSKYFTVGHDKCQLDKLNITIKFRIKINRAVLTDEKKHEIQMHIKKFIESINNDIDNIYVFDIFTSLKSSFPEIIYVEFAGINDYDSSVQIMENSVIDVRDSLVNIKDFVPEFVNIDTQKNSNGIKEPQIIITYV